MDKKERKENLNKEEIICIIAIVGAFFLALLSFKYFYFIPSACIMCALVMFYVSYIWTNEYKKSKVKYFYYIGGILLIGYAVYYIITRMR